MRTRATSVIDEHIQAMRCVLRASDMHHHDFNIVWHEACEVGQLLGLEGVITVRCLATGVERLYPTGEGEAYFGQFLMDLAHGRFAAAAESGVLA